MSRRPAGPRCTLISPIPPATRSACIRSPGSELVLQAARFGELAHRLFLLLGELLGDVDLHLDDDVAGAIVLLDALPLHPEALSRRRAGRNLDRHLLIVERLHGD